MATRVAFHRRRQNRQGTREASRYRRSTVSTQTIFIADDEQDMLQLVSRVLTRDGFLVETATNGRGALDRIRTVAPDLAILDLMMPELTGLEVCRALRAQTATANIPLIMLSARTAEVDRIVAFEVGVDDYVTKPFSPRELLLRVRALLRHARLPPVARERRQVGLIEMDREDHSVCVAGHHLALTAMEYKLLRVLMETPELVQSRESLLLAVWGDERVELRTIDTQVRRLRTKLGAAADQIETVRSFGYRVVGQVA